MLFVRQNMVCLPDQAHMLKSRIKRQHQIGGFHRDPNSWMVYPLINIQCAMKNGHL